MNFRRLLTVNYIWTDLVKNLNKSDLDDTKIKRPTQLRKVVAFQENENQESTNVETLSDYMQIYVFQSRWLKLMISKIRDIIVKTKQTKIMLAKFKKYERDEFLIKLWKRWSTNLILPQLWSLFFSDFFFQLGWDIYIDCW